MALRLVALMVDQKVQVMVESLVKMLAVPRVSRTARKMACWLDCSRAERSAA